MWWLCSILVAEKMNLMTFSWFIQKVHTCYWVPGKSFVLWFIKLKLNSKKYLHDLLTFTIVFINNNFILCDGTSIKSSSLLSMWVSASPSQCFITLFLCNATIITTVDECSLKKSCTLVYLKHLYLFLTMHRRNMKLGMNSDWLTSSIQEMKVLKISDICNRGNCRKTSYFFVWKFARISQIWTVI